VFSNIDEAKRFACDLCFGIRKMGCRKPLNLFQDMVARACGFRDFSQMTGIVTEFTSPSRDVFIPQIRAELASLDSSLDVDAIVKALTPADPVRIVLHKDGSAFASEKKLTAFLASGQPALVEFRLGNHAILVKFYPFRDHLPMFITERIGPEDQEFPKITHPTYRRIHKQTPASWFTFSLRKYCWKLGFDPDAGRPRYADDDLADQLIRAAHYALWRSDVAQRHVWCFELLIAGLDALATDQSRLKSHTVRDARKFSRWLFQDAPRPRWWHDDSPREALLEELKKHGLLDACKAAADLLLSLDDTAPLVIDGFVAPFHFLPSEYGIGCQPSLYGLPGTPEWLARNGDLEGVALLPDFDPDDLVTLAAYRELKRIGIVRFLNREEAQAYLDGEGREWIDQWPVVRVPEGLTVPVRRAWPSRRARTWFRHLWGRAE